MQYIEWLDDSLRILDQTRLPLEEVYLELRTYQQVAEAINRLRVRGAPMIGVAAAYGLALGAGAIKTSNRQAFLAELDTIAQALASTRPTAVNLFQALRRMQDKVGPQRDVVGIRACLVEEAVAIHRAEEQATERIAGLGAGLLRDTATVLTHCNAGALATSGSYGTALGVIKAAHEQGKRIRVYADETRPLLQGSRLTVWELMHASIPVTLITDSMAGYLMSKGEIDCAVVGADRIAANGDVANKIGTFTVAVLAHEHGIPFYVAAPITTIDLSIPSGEGIPIEFRDAEEVTHIQGMQVAPAGTVALNPAFDVTPHRYISAIITDKGIAIEPYEAALRQCCRPEHEREDQ